MPSADSPGGVDSSVAAALVSRAIGDRLTCLFVDNGLLRKDEFSKVLRGFSTSTASSTSVVSPPVSGFSPPCRGLRIRSGSGRSSASPSSTSFRRRRPGLVQIDFLVQGTLYPDVIESQSVQGSLGGHQEPP
jgi:GMP synthase (glutamine-hydrolysing)